MHYPRVRCRSVGAREWGGERRSSLLAQRPWTTSMRKATQAMLSRDGAVLVTALY
jgi:hypothetical protein